MQCGTAFQPYRTPQVTCSRECYRRAGSTQVKVDLTCSCQRCGVSFNARASPVGAKPKYCPTCKPIVRQEVSERKNSVRRARLEEFAPKYREWSLRKNYGLTTDAYERMLADQNGRCAICGDPPRPGSGPATKRLHVDHDHITGANRGLLCVRCNPGVGYFNDDPALLRAAADYIERYRT